MVMPFIVAKQPLKYLLRYIKKLFIQYSEELSVLQDVLRMINARPIQRYSK
jgi:hypothetical protein